MKKTKQNANVPVNIIIITAIIICCHPHILHKTIISEKNHSYRLIHVVKSSHVLWFQYLIWIHFLDIYKCEHVIKFINPFLIMLMLRILNLVIEDNMQFHNCHFSSICVYVLIW